MIHGKARRSDETRLCMAFSEHLDNYFPQSFKLVYTHIANEGRSPQQGALLKKMGVNAGWFDYIFLFREKASDEWKVSKLEAKIGKNDYGTSQRTFLQKYAVGGHERHGIFRSVKEGHEILKKWGIKPLTDCVYFKEPNYATLQEKYAISHEFFYPGKKK